MLAAQGILTDNEAAAIREGLLTVFSEIQSGNFEFSTALEDIHMNVEARLKEIVGEPAGRLHTARSRNDQVATDIRLWLRGPAMIRSRPIFVCGCGINLMLSKPGFWH